MYKNRDARRSFNRPTTNKKLISGVDSGREKTRRLSTVPEMASDEGQLVSSTAIHRKLKCPRKIFGDLNALDPSSVVPRKLRSAIRKRSSGSTLLPLRDGKRANNFENGIETLREDGLKNSEISMKAPSVPISRDEEEVAETLFALAGLIPLSDLQAKNRMSYESSNAKASDMEEKSAKSMPVFRVPKEVKAVTTTSMTNSEENSLVGPNLSERRPMNLNLRVSVPPLNHQQIPHFLRTCDQQQLMSSSFYHTLTEPSTESGRLNEIKQEKAFIPNRESLISTQAVEVENQHAPVQERRQNGVSMTSRVLHDSGIYGIHLQSSATIYPSWLSTTTSSSTDKLLCSLSSRTSWKRCALHVHISRLIKVLQISEEKETHPLETNQLRPSQSLGDTLVTLNHSKSIRGKLDGILTHTNMLSSSDYKNPHDGANIISVNHRHHQEKQQEGPSFSGCCVSKNQSFDFLSLSSRVTQASDNGVTGLRKNLEVGEKGYVVYQRSVVHQGRTIPFSLQQNRLPSNPFCDQVSPLSVGLPPTPLQCHLRGPQYLSNPYGAAHMVSMMTSAQQPQAKQQIWTAKLATQFRPGPQLASHITNWQNRRKDLQSSSSQPCPEELGAKYPHFSQQQIAVNRGKLPSIREDNGNQLRADALLTLQ